MTKRSHLKFAGLQRRSLAAYGLALQRFIAFARKSPRKISSPSDLDFTLSEYINCMYQEGEALSAAGHTLSSIKRFMPELKLQLPQSSQLFRNWQRTHRPIRAIPVSWELLQAMGAVLWHEGSPKTSLLLFVAFQCFLRTAELLSLQLCHLLPHRTKHEVAVVIPFAKTSNGNPQVLLLQDKHIWTLTRAVKRGHPSTALLWAGTPNEFRQLWARLLTVLQFRHDDYTPYGIRRGGATWFFLQSGSLDLTLARGRWAISKVAKQYLDDGTLTLARQHWTHPQKRAIKHWLKSGKQQFHLLFQSPSLSLRSTTSGSNRRSRGRK